MEEHLGRGWREATRVEWKRVWGGLPPGPLQLEFGGDFKGRSSIRRAVRGLG